MRSREYIAFRHSQGSIDGGKLQAHAGFVNPPFVGAASYFLAGALTASASSDVFEYRIPNLTKPTNPVIVLPGQDTFADHAQEDPDLIAFLDLLAEEMDQDPNSLIPADEAQLDRIARLIVGPSS